MVVKSSDTTYHAFLPPPVLTPFHGLTSDHPEKLTFHPVPIPVATPQLLQLSPARAAMFPVSPVARVSRVDQPIPNHPQASAPAPSTGDSERRRSKRLRTSGDLLGPQSQLDQSESLLSSLNTTDSISDPTASFSNFPRWTVPLAKLTTLERLLQTTPVQKQGKGKGKGKEHGWSKRITLLCCVMAVESPIQRQRRKSGVRAGELWIATWRISAPAGKSDSLSEPVSCEVKLWESCARDYGGRLRKGDVVILEDVEFVPATTMEPARIVISPRGGYAPPPPVIVYRTLPRYTAVQSDYVYRAGPRGAVPAGQRRDMNPEDRALRPDLRLARSDPGIRLVADMSKWCADWVGGEGPPSMF